MPELIALAKNTKGLRQSMHESQAEFAANCGISAKTLVFIESKKSNAKLETLQKIAAYCDCTVAELMTPHSDNDDAFFERTASLSVR